MLGDRFIQWNGMTERLEYLHIQQSMLDVFTKKWAAQSTRTVVCMGGGRAGQGNAVHTKGEQEEGQEVEGEHEKGQQVQGEHEKGQQKQGEEKKGEQDQVDQQTHNRRVWVGMYVYCGQARCTTVSDWQYPCQGTNLGHRGVGVCTLEPSITVG